MAILCLMRYEDWTYREAEVRLAEHSELRRALRLRSVPDYTTLYRFLRRLDEAAITRALNEVVHRMAPPSPRRRAQVAVDATGLAQGAVSTFFVRRMYHHTQQPLPWRHWLKWLAVVDLKRQLILAQSARSGPLERLCQLARIGRSSPCPHSDRLRVGRCRVRLRA
ncbi:MAG: transposase [Candidatus Sulfotelmatobacter sp.]